MYLVAAFLDRLNRNRNGTDIEQFFLLYFIQIYSVREEYFDSQHNNIKQRYISQNIIENILIAVYLSVLLWKKLY